MAKKKRITINALEKVMKETYEPTVEFEWNGITVSVKRTLSFGEIMGFIKGVVSACYNIDTGLFTPEMKEFAIKIMVLENYANFTLPSNPEKMYELIYCTDAYESVIANINQRQFDEICTAIDVKIDYITSASVEATNRQINNMFNSLDSVQGQLSSLLGNIDENDIKDLFGALTNGKLDEGKLMKSYFEEKPKESETPKIVSLPNN